MNFICEFSQDFILELKLFLLLKVFLCVIYNNTLKIRAKILKGLTRFLLRLQSYDFQKRHLINSIIVQWSEYGGKLFHSAFRKILFHIQCCQDFALQTSNIYNIFHRFCTMQY